MACACALVLAVAEWRSDRPVLSAGLAGLIGAAAAWEAEAPPVAVVLPALIVAVAWAVDRVGGHRVARIAAVAVVVLAIAAALLARTVHLPRAADRSLHTWNQYHYVLGTKYFHEVGYFDLYTATLAVDRQGRHHLHGIRATRDLHTYEVVSVREALRDETVLDRFTDARLAELEGDLDVFVAVAGADSFSGPLTDFGFNPSPAWLVVHTPVLAAVSIERPESLHLLALAQVPLQLGAVAAVWWAFGLRATLWVVLWTLLFFGNSGRLYGGYFTYDWWALALIATACYRRGHTAVCAPLIAWAGLMRGFVGLMALGPALHAVRDRPARRFMVALAVASAVIGGLTLLPPLGPEVWAEWVEKIGLHADRISAGGHRFGLRTLFGEDLAPGLVEDMDLRRALAQRHAVPYRLTQAVLLGLTGVALWRSRGHDTLVLGLIAAFFTMVLSRYYFATWVVLLLLSPMDRRRLGNLAVTLAMFGLLALFWASRLDDGLTLQWRYHHANLWVLALCAGVVGFHAVRPYSPPPAGGNGAQALTSA